MTIKIPQDKFQPNLVIYPIRKLGTVIIDVGTYTDFELIDNSGTSAYSTPNKTDFWKYLQKNL